MFFVGVVLFLLTSVHVCKCFDSKSQHCLIFSFFAAINLYRTYFGFVYRLTAKGGPITFLGPLFLWHQVAKDVVYVTVSILGDAVAVSTLLRPKWNVAAEMTKRRSIVHGLCTIVTGKSSCCRPFYLLSARVRP
jgi:hypothetical protein